MVRLIDDIMIEHTKKINHEMKAEIESKLLSIGFIDGAIDREIFSDDNRFLAYIDEVERKNRIKIVIDVEPIEFRITDDTVKVKQKITTKIYKQIA